MRFIVPFSPLAYAFYIMDERTDNRYISKEIPDTTLLPITW